MQLSAGEPRGITALLGPTNTGKTHQALERMLEHPTGMIGLPLRLLAREVYDRLTTRVGERHVALITGEEKRIPLQPHYFVCTVEAMPINREVDFVAVDEIQLCAHVERGHIFTERLLHARGRQETWFLGSATIRPLLERYVPTAKVASRPRLSVLREVPSLNLSRLPPRSAVVAFSTDRVYDLAAQFRHRRGGAAIVLGALSPRTRNAQVALYQSGEVDYMVATDAIGMGLNLNIDHIAFAGASKFDGREQRPLATAELAQIAGRAGRYLNQGTFGTLAPLPAFAPSIARAIESHRFPPESQLWWRNSNLDFESAESLLQSLKVAPNSRGLKLMVSAADQQALSQILQKPDIKSHLNDRIAVEMLWEICKIPDFRQLWFELHVQFLENIFLQLVGPKKQIDPDFIAQRLSAIDNTQGDIQILMDRIADIRTWTYVATHPNWVADATALKERSMSIEDRLSDALHERLVSQFVERSRTYGARLSRSSASTGLNSSSPFLVLLEQLLEKSDKPETNPEANWLESVINGSHDQFTATSQGWIYFEGKRIAKFEAGLDLLHPNVKLAANLEPGPGARSQISRRLLAYGRDLAESVLAPLRVRAASQLTPAGRGIVYQLEHNLGTIHVDQAHEQLQLLTPRDIELLTSFGVRFGMQLIYLRRALSPQAIASRAALASVRDAPNDVLSHVELGGPTIQLPGSSPMPSTLSIGYLQLGALLIRADQFEILWRELIQLNRSGRVVIPPQMLTRLGCTIESLLQALSQLGFQPMSKKRRSRRPRYRGGNRQTSPQGEPAPAIQSRASRRASG